MSVRAQFREWRKRGFCFVSDNLAARKSKGLRVMSFHQKMIAIYQALH